MHEQLQQIDTLATNLLASTAWEEGEPSLNDLDMSLIYESSDNFYWFLRVFNTAIFKTECYPVVMSNKGTAWIYRPLVQFLDFNAAKTFLPQHHFLPQTKDVVFAGSNAVDFCHNVYSHPAADTYMLSDSLAHWDRVCKENLFKGIGAEILEFSWSSLRANSVAPSKARPSDSGYDLTIIDVVKRINDRTTLYTTGIQVEPPMGWYFDVVPRSSIIKTGYMLANSVGVIDAGYTGEIMIALTQVVDDAAPIELPMRIAQLIPRRIVHMTPRQVASITDTHRAAGGFGSTG